MLWRSKLALIQEAIVELVDATKAQINFIHGILNDEKNIINDKSKYVVSKEDINQIKRKLLEYIANKADNNNLDFLKTDISKIHNNFSYLAQYFSLTTHDDSPLMQKLDNLKELYSQKFSFYDDIISPIINVINWIITKTINFILGREEPVLNSNVQEQLKAKIEELSSVTPANLLIIATSSRRELEYRNMLLDVKNHVWNSKLEKPKNDHVGKSEKKRGFRIGNGRGCTIS